MLVVAEGQRALQDLPDRGLPPLGEVLVARQVITLSVIHLLLGL